MMSVMNNEQRIMLEDWLHSKFDQNKFESITAHGENILLSAGAGCGKTTALSYRVLYQVLCQGISVSDMLILTFTENAAAEMKGRIEAVLRDFANPEHAPVRFDSDVRDYLIMEADKVATAQISTFDSFANGIVRKYADSLNISPTFTILDDSVSSFIFMKELEKVINEEFKDPNSLIRQYFDRNVAVNSKSLKSAIDVIEALRDSHSDADEILEHWKERYLTAERTEQVYRECLKSFDDRLLDFSVALNNFRTNYSDFQSSNSGGKNKDFFEQASNFCKDLADRYSYQDTSHDVCDLLKNLGVEMGRLTFSGAKSHDNNIIGPFLRTWWKEGVSSSSDPESPKWLMAEKIKEDLKGKYAALRGDVFSILDKYVDKAFYDQEAKFIDYAISIDKKVHERVMSIKREKSAFSFADVSEMCIKILKNIPNARIEENGRIKSIMVDEYQDSNDAQETLLAILGSTEDNYNLFLKNQDKKYLFDRKITFMVGDVKQSIYGFRNARPELFIDKYKNPEANNVTIKTMCGNYRSNEIVVKQVNELFGINMTETIGGVDYAGDSKQQISSENKAYKNFNETNYTELHSYYYDFLDDPNPAPKSLRKGIVALDIAKKIKSIVEGGNQIVPPKNAPYPSEAQDMPKANYGDFAILIRAKNEADAYVKAFGALNIPCTLDIDEDFKESYIIRTLENLVLIEYYLMKIGRGETLTDGEMSIYKHAIASVERSFILNVPDRVIVEDMKHIMSFGEDRPKVLSMLDELNSKKNPEEQSPNETIRHIIDFFGVYSKISTLDDPDQSMTSYNFFLNEIGSLSSMGFSYADFVDFFRQLRNGNLSDIKQEVKTFKTKGDSIMITTIHKSKGLEYPFVIVPMTNKKPSSKRQESELVFDDEYGFIPKFSKEDSVLIHSYNPKDIKGNEWDPDVSAKENPFKNVRAYLNNRKMDREAQSEHLRILYVALTRARLYNIMVFYEGTDELGQYWNVMPKERLSFRDFGAIGQTAILPEAGNTNDYNIGDLIFRLKISNRAYKEEDIKEAQGNFLLLPSDPLNKNILSPVATESKRASAEISLRSNQKSLEFGTHLHLALECLDWSDFPKLPSTDFIKEARERRLVEAFVNSDFIKSLQGKNPEFFQELPFIDEDTGHEGSMDLAIVTSDISYIIDYKSSSVDNPEYRHQVSIYRKNLSKLKGIDESKIKCYLYSIEKCEMAEIIPE